MGSEEDEKEEEANKCADELSLLWTAVEQTARLHTRSSNDARNKSTTNAAPPPPLSPHTQFIEDVTGLLFGSEYPPWMAEQWARQGGLEDEEDEEGEEQQSLRAEGEPRVPLATSSAPRVTSLADAHTSQPPSSSATPAAVIGATTQGSQRPTPVRAVVLLQRALEALQLALPLRSSAPTDTVNASSSPLLGSGESAVESLARHLLRDAPLSWLRCLLVPMYTQWQRQQEKEKQQQQQRVRVLGGGGGGAVTGKKDDDGDETMHDLLDALSAAAMRVAVQEERAIVEHVLALVQRLSAPVDSAVLTTAFNDAREALQELRQRQRRHSAELVYFTGTLARTTQSFSVLGSGAATLLLVFVTRLAGHVRASWAEWSQSHTAADMSRAGPLRDVLYGSGPSSLASRADGDVAKPERQAEAESDDQPPRQQRRVEAAACVVDTLAALRTCLTASAHQHAVELWRCWLTLFGFYGADLYVDPDVAQAVEAEAEAKAGVRLMSATQQAQWRRLRLHASVRQHVLSETHWLLCSTVVACVEASTRDAAAAARREEQRVAPAESSLFSRVMAATLNDFFAHVKGELRRYGTAAIAHRSGVLQAAATAGPAALQSVAHNTAALQTLFSSAVAESVGGSSGCARMAWVTGGEDAQTGTALWHIAPTLLRTQVADETAWMGTGGGSNEVDYDAVGADDEDDDWGFADASAAHWRRCAAQLTAAWSDTSSRAERLLTRVAAVTATQPAESADGSGSERQVQLVEEVIYEDFATAAAATAGAARLDDVSALFFSVFDATCFFVLRPERQRLFTRSIQHLCSLVAATKKRSRKLAHAPLVTAMRHDTRLWMLLAHGVLLQRERSGRMAREDEALIVSGLLPLLSVLVNSPMNGEEDDEDDESDALGATWWTWANLPSTRDMLLLLASGLLALPWSGEEMYLAVCRHTDLCERSTHVPLSPGNSPRTHLLQEVQRMSRWFDADVSLSGSSAAVRSAASGATAASAAAAAAPSVWDLGDGVSQVTSPSSPAVPPHGSADLGGPASLRQLCQQLDIHTRQSSDFHRLYAPLSDGPDVTVAEDAAEACFTAALDRHARVGGPNLSSAPCGILMVVGAYRSLSRGLYRLRTALAEQHRMARDDDGGNFVGRSVTFCTSADVSAMRTLLTVVHRVVFGHVCRPHGLLRLWIGYLQHLFCCLVPRSTSGESGGDEADTLVLMPSSWQQRHRVTNIFGARVYRTGWRALQHDGEAASHTRLREALGECLADLLLMPYRTSAVEAGDAAAGAAAALQYTLPHAVLSTLCECLAIQTGDTAATSETTSSPTTADARGAGVRQSFLGLAGLLAFLRRLELHVVPGSLQDPRLQSVLRCVYDAADAAALGV